MGACWECSACWHKRSVLWCQTSPWACAWHLPGPSRLQCNTKSLFMSLFTHRIYNQWIPEKRRRALQSKGRWDLILFCCIQHEPSHRELWTTLSRHSVKYASSPTTALCSRLAGCPLCARACFSTVLHSGKRENIGSRTVVRRWVCYTS